MKKISFLIITLIILGIIISGCSTVIPPLEKDESILFKIKGFDEFGYNYNARIFVGSADGVDRVLDGEVWGDPTYANDYLVMKWSKAWDDARFNGAPWTPDAWETNEWNGMVPGGSGEVWHYKIIWVGPALEKSPYWREGGYSIWGQFEVIMSQGIFENEHILEFLTSPNGFGGPYKD